MRNSALTNKIVVGSNKNTTLVVTEQIVTFKNGTGTVNGSGIANAYSKTIRNAMAQIKSASSVVITGVNVSSNVLTIKCSNLTGTPFEGELSASILIFMS